MNFIIIRKCIISLLKVSHVLSVTVVKYSKMHLHSLVTPSNKRLCFQSCIDIFLKVMLKSPLVSFSSTQYCVSSRLVS